MSAFDFQKLDVYRVTIEFIVAADAIIDRMPRGRAYLVDQLRRAGSSIALNIGGGAGEAVGAEKVRFYGYARRSPFECAAVLDVLRAHHIGDETELWTADQLLQRIGAMLTRMTTAKKPDSDSGAARLDSDSDSAHPLRDSDSDSANTTLGA